VLELVSAICFTVLILLAWFNTDVFITYTNLVGLGKFFRAEGFLKDRKTGHFDSYPLWLLAKKPGFVTKLLSCPICLGTWVGGALGYTLLGLAGIPVIIIPSLLLFFTFNILINFGDGV
jgi:hypothetical protein